jgi:ribosomal-protein-alanine N-acetyltransferase
VVMSLQITAMTPADVPAVAAIEARQHLTPWQENGFRDALCHGWPALVLRAQSSAGPVVLGYVVSMRAGDDEELLTITVVPEASGQGYGRRLLACLLDAAQQRGAKRLLLEVRQSNTRAIRLYTSAGFTIDGMRKNYYAIPADPVTGTAASREDAVLMSCDLQQPRGVHE